MTEQDLAALSFKAAAHDMETIVRHIAERYIRQGVPLTWRLLHAVEAEALADLGFASRHDPMVRCLFDRPAELRFPETDDLVDFGQSNALPAVFSFAVAAYERARTRAPTRLPCRHAPHVRRAHGATSFSPQLTRAGAARASHDGSGFRRFARRRVLAADSKTLCRANATRYDELQLTG